MASDNNSDSQDEKTALVQGEPAREDAQAEELQLLRSCEQSESKMTLYHWTQSFNSQKVSPRFSTTEGADSSLMMPVGLIVRCDERLDCGAPAPRSPQQGLPAFQVLLLLM